MIGRVKFGSFRDGLIIELIPNQNIEDLRIGEFIKILGSRYDFIGMITDLRLNILNPDVFLAPPVDNELLRYSVNGTLVNSEIEFFPLVSIERESNSIHSVKSIPSHFDEVTAVSQKDMDIIFSFGEEKDVQAFSIGNILSMEYLANINLSKLIERSFGVFGSTGSGKTFFTRIILAGLIKKDVCANLIFDFHEEYGIKGASEESDSVPGLAYLFGSKVIIYTVEPKGLTREKCIQIPLSDIEPEDIRLISKELRLSEMSFETALSVRRACGKNWIEKLLNLDPDDINNELTDSWKVHPESLQALIRHLQVLKDLSFLVPSNSKSCVRDIMDYLQNGQNVIIQFNNLTHQRLSYLLISSILTRRIYSNYRNTIESGKKLKHLLITIEEAHNFLSPEISKETIFGEIARELRKFDVTLLIVDQIPSQIDPEVISQLGTRVIFNLNSEKDLDYSLEGVQGKNKLKQILYSIDNKGEALIVGYAMPIPLAFKVRRYDDSFFREMKSISDIDTSKLDPKKFFYGD